MFKRCSATLLLACAGLLGQATTSLRGTVKDSTGALIPETVLTLTDAATGSFRKGLSSKNGDYQFLQLAPGIYSLKAEKTGFSTLVKSEIRLEVNTPATVDCVLEVGLVTSTVNVEADAGALNTVDASLGNAFAERQVKELPLQTRNVVELLSIEPGVTQTGEVLGARRDQNNVTLDGVDVNNNQNSGVTSAQTNGSAAGSEGNTPGFNAALPIPLDSVEEFRVTVAGQGAEMGRSSGGQVTLVTKSGTNSLHATFYEYNRNTVLAANSYFNNQAGIARAPLVRNQFGNSIGGPIIKNRIFLFGNWERRIDASSTPVTRTVPSDSLRQGNLKFALSDGSIQTLSPAEVQAIDPLHLGYSSAMKSYLTSFPTGNDSALGLDKGLNFTGFRFNSPQGYDQTAYVAKADIAIDSERKHNLSIRGTLNGGKQDLAPAQYPGQSAAQQLIDNSKGISANYTWVVKPNLINSATFGLTRLGLNDSGTLGTVVSFTGISPLAGTTTPTGTTTVRPSIQLLPTYNLADNLTWTKGAHTITGGINFRFIRNSRTSYTNAFPAYSFNRNTLGGLGGDATTFITDYINQNLGTTGLTLSQPTAATSGLGGLLGLINQYSAVYQFTKDGSIIPFGTPAMREYAVNNYEGYIQDSWRIRPDLTINVGLRYINSSVPWETHGTEVVTTVPLENYFAQRVGAMNAGTPAWAIPDAALTYTLGGAANGKKGWYERSNLNFAPRFSFAYAPESDGKWWNRFLGKGSVIRGGFALLYDQYGSDMVFNVDQSGSPGLASSVTQPVNTNFTNSPRFAGLSTLPALPSAPKGGFPYTPPTITGGFDEGVGVASNLKAPYSMVVNLTWAKKLPSNLSLEVGYAGRLYRRGLLQQDFDQPLTQFKDPASGTTWAQASTVMHNNYLAAGQTYGPIAPIPFIENMFPGLRNAYVPGSATQNYYQSWIVQNGLSDLDNLNQADRQRIGGTNNCYSKLGCNTFFPLQAAGLPTWTNAGFSNYHAATFTLRRQFAKGVGFDLNYTWSHSIDNSSGAESGAGTGGAILQDAFNPGAFRGSSDFDTRHNITGNLIYELPFGKGKSMLNGGNALVNQIVGGWQVSTIMRYHSGLPTTISSNGAYPTNYEYSAMVNLIPGATNDYGEFIDNNGVPSIFANTSASGNYFQQAGGSTGTRAIVRLPGFVNFDVAFMKTFGLPFEGHRLQFRGELFNVFNHVNFYNPVLDVNSTATFGELQSAFPARVVQLSLRYAF